MRRRGGGAERGDGVFDAILGKCHHVHITFHHDRSLRVADRPPCVEQAVQLTPFLKQRRLRRVQVFGLPLANDAAAETNNIAALIEDWKHHPIAEAIIATALLVIDHQSAFRQRCSGVVVDRALEPLPVVGRIAEAELRGNFTADAAALEIIDRFR